MVIPSLLKSKIMNELKEIVEKKLEAYKSLNEIAIELNQEGNRKYYTECIDRLGNVLNLLIAH